MQEEVGDNDRVVSEKVVSPSGQLRPNVLVILFDDLGFAQMGCFGADFDTPNLDRLAAKGLRYNRFHVTAMCSASRASLLTGRNHHAVGVGNLVLDNAQHHPGHTGRIPKAAGTLPRILRDAGYSTFAIGKWHLAPISEESHAGPFDHWPLGLGFERYYGFIRAEANQWAPMLAADNHYIETPRTPEEGYHVTEDFADQAIRMIVDQRQAAKQRPFFMYFAPGAMHSPHHVPREWIEGYRGRFDQGWDRWREEVFARQLSSGVVPPGTVLTERPPWVAAWDGLSADERRLFARMHEVYAGFMTHTDAQIGRLLFALEALGELENTVVIVTSDNGASAEGGPPGSFNENRFSQRLPDSLEANLSYLDDWGGMRGYYHYSWGWAWAGNTPFRLWKRYAWLGGTRVPLIVHCPSLINSDGQVRSQFTHLVDVMPTVLDAADVAAPESIDGVVQQRIDGGSFASTFADPDAPSPRDVQYFEMLGSRSIVQGKWKATTDHVGTLVAAEELLMEGSRYFEEDRWSLFDIENDFSEASDLAEEHPQILAELQERWATEAERNNVLPLFDKLYDVMLPVTEGVRRRATFLPSGSPVLATSLPPLGHGGQVTAVAEIPSEVTEGVLCSFGDWNSGFALYVLEGRLRFTISVGGVITRAVSQERIARGRHEMSCRLSTAENSGTTLELLCCGRTVGSEVYQPGIPVNWKQGGSMALHLGRDQGLPVCDDFVPPFAWTGVLYEVHIECADPPASDPAEDLRAALHAD